MKRCSYCNSLILFGGVTDYDLQFCNEKCHGSGHALTLAEKIPDDVITRYSESIHQGSCPCCQGGGPIDVHTSYFVWSALLLTSWSSKPKICCRSCGIKSQIGYALGSGLVGWWGFPWGLIFTPVQIIRNFKGLLVPPNPSRPSESLKKLATILLSEQYLQQNHNIVQSNIDDRYSVGD